MNQLTHTVIECGSSVLEVNNSRCKIDFDTDGQKVKKINMTVKVSSDFKEFGGKSLSDKSEINKICHDEEKAIYEEITSLMKVAEEKKTDIMCLQESLSIQSFGKIKNTKKALEGVKVNLKVNCSIEKSYNMKKGVK
jgi:hypothetical protein